MKRFIGAVILGLVCSLSVSAGGFSLKVTGGVAAINGGDYNQGVQGTNDLNRALYLNVKGGFAKLDRGFNLALEGIYHITPRFGLGLGIGYCSTRESDTVEYDWISAGKTYHDKITAAPVFFAVPITLNLHYLVSLVFGVKLDLTAGLGWYICRFDFDSRLESSQFDWNYHYTWKADKSAFGLQGGLGLEIPLYRGLSFVLDLFGRWVRVENIVGSWTYDGSMAGYPFSTSGDEHYFWYYEVKSGGLWYSQTALQQHQPKGFAIDRARKGHFDYSGIAATAGFKIRL